MSGTLRELVLEDPAEIKKLRRMAMVKTRNPDIADDLLQRTMLWLCINYEQYRWFRNKKEALLYLYKAIQNDVREYRCNLIPEFKRQPGEFMCVYDQTRAEYFVANEDYEIEDGLEVPLLSNKKGHPELWSKMPLPDVCLVQRDVQHALAQLPPKQRYVAEQLFMHTPGKAGKSRARANIAREMGTYRMEVLRLEARARKNLQQLLADYRLDHTDPAEDVKASQA